MPLRAIDPRRDAEFFEWFDILDRSESLREMPGEGGWQPDEWRARALPADPTVIYALATFDVDNVPSAAVAFRLSDDENRNVVELHLHVDPSRRRKGVGTAALTACEQMVLQLGRTSITAVAREGRDEIRRGPSRHFAPERGYRIGDDIERRDIDWPLNPDVVRSCRSQWASFAAGYHFEQWVGSATDRRAHQLADLIGRMPAETPHADFSLVTEHWDIARFRQHEATIDEMGRDVMTTIAIESRTGAVVGYTQLTVSRIDTHTAYQWDTFVTAEHRGHRLGGLMKLANYDVAAARRLALRRIRTENSVLNQPMIAVNDALGAYVSGSTALWVRDLVASRGAAPMRVTGAWDHPATSSEF